MICGIPTIELFAQGHNACAGCGAALTARHTLKAAGKNTIVVNATGCLEVFSTPYPETAWKVPWLHGAFENAAAVASGVDSALKKLNKREKTNLIVIGGDGATFDIGLGALSGAFERGNKFCYICYDNNAYMNTGIQRSSATPKYASTTTSPAGKKIHGKMELSKDVPFIMAAHGVYVATVNIAYPQDYIQKVRKALEKDGPSYIQVLSPCVPGWGIPSGLSIKVAKLAFQSRAYPMFEIEDGVLSITRRPSRDAPVEEYLKLQGRFKHLTELEIQKVQENVDAQWKKLVKLDESKIKIF